MADDAVTACTPPHTPSLHTPRTHPACTPLHTPSLHTAAYTQPAPTQPATVRTSQVVDAVVSVYDKYLEPDDLVRYQP